jgi:hypothetical protein
MRPVESVIAPLESGGSTSWWHCGKDPRESQFSSPFFASFPTRQDARPQVGVPRGVAKALFDWPKGLLDQPGGVK